MQWPGWGVWVRKGCGCLACTVEKRRGEVRPVEEKKYLGSKMIFYKLCTRPPPPLPKTMKCKSIYTGWKRDIYFLMVSNLGSWFNCKLSQLLVQNEYCELLNLTGKRLIRLVILGWHCGCCGVTQPKWTIPRWSQMSSGHFLASFVKFGEG